MEPSRWTFETKLKCRFYKRWNAAHPTIGYHFGEWTKRKKKMPNRNEPSAIARLPSEMNRDFGSPFFGFVSTKFLCNISPPHKIRHSFGEHRRSVSICTTKTRVNASRHRRNEKREIHQIRRTASEEQTEREEKKRTK